MLVRAVVLRLLLLLLSAGVILLWAVLALAQGPGLTDTVSHPPPPSGPFAYSTFRAGQPGFVAVGQTYVDPVFGTTIRRLTNVWSGLGSSIIYSRNDLWNADSTVYLVNAPANQVRMLNSSTGAVVRANPPYPFTTTDQTGFDPVDPSKYYFTQTNGSMLSQLDLTTGQVTTLATFPGLQFTGLGQSATWMDRTGRYMLLAFRFDPDHYVARLYDKQTGVLYAGGILYEKGGAIGIPPGWATLSPDGVYILLILNPQHWSFVIDHATQRINGGQTTLVTAGNGTMFWDCGFDHGAVLSATDGKTYLITNGTRCDDTTTDSVYRVDVSLNQAGRGPTQLQVPNALFFTRLKSAGNQGTDGHYSCPQRGVNKDWFFLNKYYQDDTFTNPGTWVPYKQELIAVHALTLEVRRLAHHRSRFGKYCSTPRTNSNWDGTKVAWTSNYGAPEGATGCGYSDHYVLEVGALAGAPPPPPPGDTTPPVRSQLTPSGTLPATTTQATLGVVTNEPATCHYDTVAGTAYASMPGLFSADPAGTQHSATLAVQAGQSYTFFVRCQDTAGNANPNDVQIQFAVAAAPPPPGTATLLLFYPLDQASGTVAPDASGQNHPGLLVGGAKWVNGQTGNSVKLDGVNDTIQVQAPLSMTSGITVAGWVRLETNQLGTVYALGAPALMTGFHELTLGPSLTQLTWRYSTGSSLGAVTLPFNWGGGNWVHVAVTQDYATNTISIYRNGTLAQTLTPPEPVLSISAQGSRWGSSLTNTGFVSLRLDTLRVYDGVVPASQIPSLQ